MLQAPPPGADVLQAVLGPVSCLVWGWGGWKLDPACSKGGLRPGQGTARLLQTAI